MSACCQTVSKRTCVRPQVEPTPHRLHTRPRAFDSKVTRDDYPEGSAARRPSPKPWCCRRALVMLSTAVHGVDSARALATAHRLCLCSAQSRWRQQTAVFLARARSRRDIGPPWKTGIGVPLQLTAYWMRGRWEGRGAGRAAAVLREELRAKDMLKARNYTRADIFIRTCACTWGSRTRLGTRTRACGRGNVAREGIHGMSSALMDAHREASFPRTARSRDRPSFSNVSARVGNRSAVSLSPVHLPDSHANMLA